MRQLTLQCCKRRKRKHQLHAIGWLRNKDNDTKLHIEIEWVCRSVGRYPPQSMDCGPASARQDTLCPKTRSSPYSAIGRADLGLKQFIAPHPPVSHTAAQELTSRRPDIDLDNAAPI